MMEIYCTKTGKKYACTPIHTLAEVEKVFDSEGMFLLRRTLKSWKIIANMTMPTVRRLLRASSLLCAAELINPE